VAERSAGALAPISFGDSTRIYPNTLARLPLPPESLMFSVGSSAENFLAVGRIWAQVISAYTPDEATILDLGCGCGRVARFLIENQRVERYIGFDVIRENIGWARQYLAPQWGGKCELYWFDVYSAEYNPSGALPANQLVIPCETGAADIVFAASLFTHLLEPDAIHYLQEIRRVLSPRGKAILSIHTQPRRGMLFSGSESRIDVEPSHFVQLAAQAGLREQDRRTPHDAALQMELIFAPDPSTAARQEKVDIPRLRLEALAAELVALQKTSASEVDALREPDVAKLRDNLARFRSELTRLQDESSRLRDELSAERERRITAEEIRDAILGSVSWRVTRPARYLMRLLRSFRGSNKSY
jgi:SAM-dependent methyltransferase